MKVEKKNIFKRKPVFNLLKLTARNFKVGVKVKGRIIFKTKNLQSESPKTSRHIIEAGKIMVVRVNRKWWRKRFYRSKEIKIF